MKQRALSLDLLRGYAIVTMVLSGQMYMTLLPAWMAHAQVPPGKSFDPTIFGITWVDLVFPFFLFSMGAAFSFSIGNKVKAGVSTLKLSWDAFVRAAQLIFFAIFFHHTLPFVVDSPSSVFSNCLSIFSFGLMFLMFMNIEIPSLKGTNYGTIVIWAIKLSAFLVGFLIVYNLTYAGKKNPEFEVGFSNIIIIVLANMALFASIIYIFTFKNTMARLAVLPFVMAVFLSSTNEGWVKELYNYSPIPWAYSFYYLKYLFIVLIGSVAGDYLNEWISTPQNDGEAKGIIQPMVLCFISFLLVLSNVIFLFTRQLELNLLITILLLVGAKYILKNRDSGYYVFWKKLFVAGAYCLLLGLTLEAFEGGIRKDGSTYSYYFVTSGLAFFALLFFSIIGDYFEKAKWITFLKMTGQNPMIAYVASSLVVLPLIELTGLSNYFYVFEETSFMGFLRGVLITTVTVLITMFFTRFKWFWRT